jgi:hypothetical protein
MRAGTGLILAAAVAAVGLSFAAIMGLHVHEQPSPPVSPEQNYIDSVVSQGLLDRPAADRQEDKLLHLGGMVCDGVKSGMDDNEIVPVIRAEGHLNSHQADIVRVAAELHLCGKPGYQ